MTIQVPIRHPDWLERDPMECSGIEDTLRMYRQGKLPPSIAGWMIVVGCMRPLRAVYGSNLRAGLMIVRDALIEKFTALRYRLRLLTPTERRWEREFEDEEFENDIFEALKGMKDESR